MATALESEGPLPLSGPRRAGRSNLLLETPVLGKLNEATEMVASVVEVRLLPAWWSRLASMSQLVERIEEMVLRHLT